MKTANEIVGNALMNKIERLNKVNKRIQKLVELSSSKEARIKELEEGLNTIIGYNLQEAHDRYGDKNKAEQWACVVAARKALGTK